MSAEIIPFAFEDHLIRVVEIDGDPWFVGRDVCRALALAHPETAFQRLDEDEKGMASVHTPGGAQDMTIVSEPGVYRLVFTSRKPEAERFKRWLAHDVLPQIRRTGRYAGPDTAQLPFADDVIDGLGPVATLQVRLGLLRECRLDFGPAAARRLWRALGLPIVETTVSAAGTADGDALACLAKILDHNPNPAADPDLTLREQIEAALDGDDGASRRLEAFGIAVDETADGFLIGNTADAIGRILDGSRFGTYAWGRILKRLPGARVSGRFRVDGDQMRGTFLPARWLDRGAVTPPA